MKLKRGITREVILVGKIAFKIPSFRSWYLFLEGMQCNINEYNRQKCSKHFCSVFRIIPGGFLNVMPRCEESDWNKDMDDFFETDEMHLYVERKNDSFGYLNGKLKVIDYGS